MKLKDSTIKPPSQDASEDRSRLTKRKPSEERLLHKPQLEQTRVMSKKNGYIGGYSANTFHGLVRNYNEDRVSIILNITKPEALEKWPKCSYFAVFDGHGGSLCSDFLRDNMHKYIIEDKNFPFKPVEALRNGFYKAESEFKKLAESTDPVNKSGSCAIVVIIIDKNCYVANVGDSRAIMSIDRGRKVIALSNDHKPNSPSEKSRIILNGGNIYQSLITTKAGTVVPGPWRINPGRLSVSRAIGDIQAKDQKYQGLPGVLISEPEITCFEILPEEQDYILIGCDGIFDKLQNQEIIDAIWKTEQQATDSSQFLSLAVSAVLQQSMNKKSMDNITAVLILIDKQARKIPLQPKKSLSNLNFLQNQSHNMKSRKDLKKVLEDYNKSRKRQCQSQSKENTNTANILHQDKEEKEEEMLRMKKKSSVQVSTKRLQLMKKSNQMASRKKIYEYIRY